MQAAVQFGQPLIKDLSAHLRAVIVNGVDDECVWVNQQTIQGLFICLLLCQKKLECVRSAQQSFQT